MRGTRLIDVLDNRITLAVTISFKIDDGRFRTNTTVQQVNRFPSQEKPEEQEDSAHSDKEQIDANTLHRNSSRRMTQLSKDGAPASDGSQK